jgi:ABC-2 type transport system ATP-binding protein
VTVILTTHDMDDIEELAQRVMVIGQGRILCDGTLEDLRRRVNQNRRLIVDVDDPVVAVNIEGASLVGTNSHRLTFEFDPTIVPTARMISEVTAVLKVRDLFVENPPIEQTVAALYTQTSSPTR